MNQEDKQKQPEQETQQQPEAQGKTIKPMDKKQKTITKTNGWDGYIIPHNAEVFSP